MVKGALQRLEIKKKNTCEIRIKHVMWCHLPGNIFIQFLKKPLKITNVYLHFLSRKISSYYQASRGNFILALIIKKSQNLPQIF